MLMLILATLIMSAVVGFVVSGGHEFFLSFAGQTLHVLLSVVCFTLIGIAFWRFGWKVGAIDFVLVLIAGNVASSFHQHLSKIRERSSVNKLDFSRATRQKRT